MYVEEHYVKVQNKKRRIRGMRVKFRRQVEKGQKDYRVKL